jgi:hypothetical protein
MLKFFALYKRKITGISNTAFYHQIGIILPCEVQLIMREVHKNTCEL